MNLAELNAEDFDLGLYDSDTGESLAVEKVVDVTPAIPSGERTIFLYTTAKRGRIVQILHPYEGKNYGAATHFFIDELPNLEPHDDTLVRLAKHAGLSRFALRALIIEHANHRTLPNDH